MNPLVSIITPSYNQAAYLPDAILSVLSQDYSPIEYWVVDGASTDGSVEIIQSYSCQLAGWVSEQDSGQAEAINKGLQYTRGEIVAWLNSDDFYLPQAISQAVKVFQANPALGLIFGEALTVDQTGRPLNRLVFGEWGLPQLVKFHIVCQPAVFMRRAFLEQAGLLDPTYHFMLDHQLWLRIAQLAPIQYAGSPRSRNPAQHFPWAAARHHARAKNVSNALGFSQETLRLLAWMHTVPALQAIIQNDPHGVQAGAHRLSARYLLDGEHYREALQSYIQAVKAKPTYGLKHWHRMLYALLAGMGFNKTLDKLRSPFQSRRQLRLQKELASSSIHAGSLENWPGINLHNS